MNNFYVYIYLDPRKIGQYKYGNHIFNYEPFYIGKGTGKRYLQHLKTKVHYNPYFARKINSIIQETNNPPIILIYKNGLNEKEAFLLEKELIKIIGKNILTNLTDGGDGVCGFNLGKTYEELYGKDKAMELRILRSKSRPPTLGGKHTLERCKEQSKFMKINNPMHTEKINFKGSLNPNTKEYLISDSTNNKYYVRCLKTFCQIHNLGYNAMLAMATGRKKSLYKGWSCSYWKKNGLCHINIELSSLCNKECGICGRKEREKLYGFQNYGFMNFDLLKKIATETPSGITVAFHNNGEGLLYPRFGEAVKLFKHTITYIVTNGKLLYEKANEIINNLDIISISIIETDDEQTRLQQIDILRKFLKLKENLKPNVTLRFVGKINEKLYEEFNLLKIHRSLHLPQGSVGYTQSPVIPEHGICMDLLTRLSIDRFGYVSVCVRYDPEGELILGNIKETSLLELWNSPKRTLMLNQFIKGKRNEIPYCGNKCHYWGIPVGQ